MNRLLVLFFCIAFLVASRVHAQIAHDISFMVKNFGINVEGRFDTSTVSGTLDLAALHNTRLSARIAVNSINTDNEIRDKHLLKAKYFDAAQFATIAFESTEFRKQTEGTYELLGDLTIKGITKAIVLNMHSKKVEGGMQMEGEMLINRHDYGVGGSSLVMSKSVMISIVLEIPKI